LGKFLSERRINPNVGILGSCLRALLHEEKDGCGIIPYQQIGSTPWSAPCAFRKVGPATAKPSLFTSKVGHCLDVIDG